MKLLQRIEEYTVNPNDSKRQIAEFILDHKNDIYRISMERIAEQTFSSKSALVRFGKSLGFNGWKDFTLDLIEEIRYEKAHYSDINPNIPFERNDTYADIIHKIATIQIEGIQDTADQIDEKILNDAVSMLLTASRIVILGVSPNNLIGEIFRRKMGALGRSVEVISSGEIGMAAHSLTKNDVAIIISYSGNDVSREPMKFIPTMKENRVNLIGLTSDGGNYMHQEIDTILMISSRERLYKKISNFSTEESILFLLNILYAGYFSKDYIRNYNYKVKNSILLEETRRVKQTDIKE